MKNIYWFNKLTKEDIPKVGGKGANLGELTSLGVSVPNGFCLSSKVYFDFIRANGIDKLIQSELSNIDPEDNKALLHSSKVIKEAILSKEVNLELQKEILAAYRKLGQDKYVAVRSSATAEDLPTASFAGQQATFLNTRGEKNLIEAVKKCWASLFEPRAIYYRTVNKFDHMKVGLAIPIQLMVESDVAGVMFTIDPVTNDKNLLDIEVAYGLGEVVVSGAVSPDRYLVDKNTLEIKDKKIVKQTWAIKRAGATNKRVKIAFADQEKQKLTDKEIESLAKIGKIIEEHYGSPQDTEFAVSRGKIFMVQSRPVTTLKTKAKSRGTIQGEHRVILKGAAASVGQAAGAVKIVSTPQRLDKITKGDVLVAKMTNPSYVPAMKRASAIITDQGGQTSHAAIVSRELAIPCVVGTSEATKILNDGDIVTVDGEEGLVYEGNVVVESQEEVVEKVKKIKTRTKIYVNLAEVEAAERISKLPVDGVGLLRAEFMIAEIGEHPRAMLERGKGREFVNKLANGMERFAKAFHPRPVIYRATDFKTNEYKNLKGGAKYEHDEPNPMIGYRGAMRYIQEPDLFELEIKAMKKVRKIYKNLHLMIPFVRTLDEMEKVIALLKKFGLPRTKDFELYVMCEVPSTVILAQEFIDLGIDGFSIGSNDLTQLTLGLDRDNERVASEFDERNPAVMQSMKKVIEICKKNKVKCSICGQAPSVYPEVTEALIEWGMTSVSVNPDVIIKTRELVAEVEKKIK
ncbi:MAG: phosphoenolpyruvate synthase [Candidatus Berkelbacteria bacterium]|nr:phosphoenolpyruvate synthase [Candidatus Berkelbacteria bacterium]